MIHTDLFPERELLQQSHREGQPFMAEAADLAAALKKRLSGEVRFDTGSRALYATDLSIENVGDRGLRFIEVFRASRFQDMSLSEWLSHTPPELVMAHLNIDEPTYNQIPKEKPVVLPE